MEAASGGVPLMAMAFFADQYRNARVVERNGWGLAFDKLLLMEGSGEFTEAIGHLLREEKLAKMGKIFWKNIN
jgi:UDP:flavonoid glycosyltransferase YjiC (YdhE family)